MSGGKVVVSYSELATYRDCPLKHALAYKQGWRRREEDVPEKRRRGTSWHEVMEAHYGYLQAYQQNVGSITPATQRLVLAAARDVVRPSLYQPDGSQTEQQELIEWMYDGHVAQWGADIGWKVLDIETKFIVPLPSVDGKGLSNRYFLVGFIDLLIEDQFGKRWVVDHKSADNLPKQNDLQLDDQFGLYVWAQKQLGTPALGAIHSANRTHRNVGDKNGTKPMLLSDRLARTPIFRTDTELDNIARDAARAARATRQPEVPFSSPNPMQCKWKCDFTEVHLAMRRGINPRQALLDFGFVQKERKR